MLKKILKWLSDRNVIKLKIIKENTSTYCPLCLSDIEICIGKDIERCPVCDTKLYRNS